MRKFLFIIMILFSSQGFGQSIKLSPTPIQIGGLETASHSEISAEYKNVGIHYFYALYPNEDWFVDPNSLHSNIGHSKSTLGISYTPINIFDTFYFGGIATYHRFPVSKATRFNFIIDFGLNIKKSRISLSHISNGLGYLHSVNPGYNAISFRYLF